MQEGEERWSSATKGFARKGMRTLVLPCLADSGPGGDPPLTPANELARSLASTPPSRPCEV